MSNVKLWLLTTNSVEGTILILGDWAVETSLPSPALLYEAYTKLRVHICSIFLFIDSQNKWSGEGWFSFSHVSVSLALPFNEINNTKRSVWFQCSA